MGLFKQAKIGAITADAERAIAEGRTRFVARYWDEVVAFQGTGSVSGAAEAIENVEAAGWKLDHAAYTWVDGKNRGLTLLIFSR